MVVSDYYDTGTDATITVDTGTIDTTVIIFAHEEYIDEVLEIKKTHFGLNKVKTKKVGKFVMSVTVEFQSDDSGGNPKVVIPYNYGDFEIKALHTSCVLAARRHGNKYINVLEKKRLGEQNAI
jgi:hypothetical protein